MTELPTGTVTFLFTDLEGSTRLWEEHPDAMRAALARHDEILRNAVEKREGVVVKTTGDGLHAAFAIAPDALAAAIDAQRALVAEDWLLPEPLKVRMGVHTGAAELRDGDYYGPAVNRAARLAAAAHGEQVVASASTADLARDDLGTEVDLVDLGEHRLRDLGRPERIVQVNHPDLPSDFPPLRSLDAYPGNLPVQRSAFIGRREELAEVRAALDGSPVVTLTGVGGVGKTRLALQVAADVVTRFPDGAWFVDLGPVLDAGFVPATVSASLALPERRRGTLEESIVAALGKKRLLVVLDNCEHVVDAVAALVDMLVESCPGVSVLASSREALGVEGELTYEVRPLPTPAAGQEIALDALMENDAIRLFVERARAVKRGFALTDDTAPVVAELCQRLDGIPLAIELAAARLQLMAPAEVLARLDERFGLLTGGRRTVLERHQTLRGAIDWSYTLLDPGEQLLFARLSVFAGGFTLYAAEAVTTGEGLAPAEVLARLGSLVAKSMVVTDDTAAGTRYRLLETLREYAREKLGEVDDPAQVQAGHAEHFLVMVETAAEQLKGPDGEAWCFRLDAEQDNLRAALGWARDHGEPDALIRLVLGLESYWSTEGSAREAFQWHSAALEHGSTMPTMVRASVLGFAGQAANSGGYATEGIAFCRASVECSRAAHQTPMPVALAMLGIYALESNEPEQAIAFCDEGLTAARERGGVWLELNALQFLSLACSLGGEPERGREVADEMLAGARRLGNRYLIAQALFNAGLARVQTEPEVAVRLLEEAAVASRIRNANRLGQTAFFCGIAHLQLRQVPEAAQALRTSLPLMQETGSDFFTSTVLATAAVLIARAAPAAATQLLGALDRYATESGIPGAPADVATKARTRARVEQALDARAFAEAWALGAEMTIDEAAALAHEELGKIEA
ncbi:MAG: adenylate/guanylate cyclase domain-containing protein [Acidimicrobiia bacterium]|nr:adenylate/guanylate cyclase domain-containing protein [Acidimicrobiia bacterium]